jgi:hypothetical protein
MIQNEERALESPALGISDRTSMLAFDQFAPMATQSQSVSEPEMIRIDELLAFEPEAPSEAGAEIPLWEQNPFELLTWWEMQQFSAFVFYTIGYLLEMVRTDCLLKCGATFEGLPIAQANAPIDKQTRERAIKAFTNAESGCREIGMQISADTAADGAKRLGQSDFNATYLWVINEIKSIETLIRREMSGKFFIYISPERAKFWPSAREQFIFGKNVHDAFPSTFYDIGQSGVCLSMGCTTASVFHLMRVLETGLRALGKIFGVSLDHSSWGPAILQIESKIREMHVDPQFKSLPDCKQQQQFYADAASHFGILKDAWRNHTMHARSKYTDQEAQQIFGSVKAFMQKLAERLKE